MMDTRCFCSSCVGGEPPRCPYPLTVEGQCSHHLDNVCQTVIPHSPQRIQRRRTAGWRMPEGAVYVGRPSRWGNPYTLDELAACYPEADDRELRRMATSDFRGLVEGKWGEDRDYPVAAVADLAGRDLACWCPLDQPCHADVLLEVANR